MRPPAVLIVAGAALLPAPAPAGAGAERFSEGDRLCLALNVYHEARNQPFEGQLAVAHVTLNRLDASPFPRTICEVVYATGYFSWTYDPRKVWEIPAETDAWETAQQVAWLAIVERHADPVDGSTFFHAVSAEPHWASAMIRVRQIGDHVFYVAPRDNPYRPRTSDMP